MPTSLLPTHLLTTSLLPTLLSGRYVFLCEDTLWCGVDILPHRVRALSVGAFRLCVPPTLSLPLYY